MLYSNLRDAKGQPVAVRCAGGKIAQIGSRLIDMAAQKMAREFFEKFTAVLVERQTPAPAEGEATAGADAEGGEKKGWLKKLIGKS